MGIATSSVRSSNCTEVADCAEEAQARLPSTAARARLVDRVIVARRSATIASCPRSRRPSSTRAWCVAFGMSSSRPIASARPSERRCSMSKRGAARGRLARRSRGRAAGSGARRTTHARGARWPCSSASLDDAAAPLVLGPRAPGAGASSCRANQGSNSGPGRGASGQSLTCPATRMPSRTITGHIEDVSLALALAAPFPMSWRHSPASSPTMRNAG
jgi:hypothetical protein